MQKDRTALPRPGALLPSWDLHLIPVSILCLVNEFLFPGKSQGRAVGWCEV